MDHAPILCKSGAMDIERNPVAIQQLGPTPEHLRRAIAAAPVLHRQRGFSLPGSGVRGAAVCPGRTARRRLAADRQRRADLRRVAKAVALFPAAGCRGAMEHRGAGRGARLHEHLFLPGDRPPAAGHRRRDRVSRADRAGAGRHAQPAQRGGAGRRGGRRMDADPCAARRRADGLRLRLRELRALHAVHRARTSRGERRRQRGHRSARRGDAGGACCW